MTPVCLTIAGSDPSGGAGIQADLKVFHQHRTYGESVITLLTVQNTCGVTEVNVLSPAFVRKQLEAVITDIPPQAAKTGALGSKGMIAMIADAARQFSFPLIVDPVMISKHGAALLAEDAVDVLRTELLPAAYLVTPNLHEAEALTRMKVSNLPEMKEAAEKIHHMGAKHVLIKGGHLEGASADLLFSAGCFSQFPAPRIKTQHTHGTGCSFSAAITARIAQGMNLNDAVQRAKQYITGAILTAPQLGKGCGPTNLLTQCD